jgi:glucosyl-3-phosphoglycerate synthase
VRGLARDLAIASWVERRTYRSEDYTLDRVRSAKRQSVSFVLPARNVAGTIGQIIDVLGAFEMEGLIDEIVVVDAASPDGTARVVAERGVTVYQESDLMTEFGRACGKGDAMWRGLAATKGEIIVYVDTDTEDFQPNFVLGMLGPIFEDPEIQLVKGTFSRPFKMGDSILAEGGGRVTELLARPFLNLHVPELAGFSQPLAGEIAARRCLLEALPFPVGYGIEIAMLIDSVRLVGADALAQVDLGVRQNRHQPLRELAGMAYAVLAAASARLIGQDFDAYPPGPLALPSSDGLEMRWIPFEERPPLGLTLSYESMPGYEGTAEDAS